MHCLRSLVVGIVLTALAQLTLTAQNIGSEYAQVVPGRASGAVLQSMVDSSKSSTVVRQNPDDDSSFGEDPDNRLMIPFVKHLATDQRTFWTAPIHFHTNDLKWIAPFAGITAGLTASDSWTSKQIPLGRIETSKKISNYGLYSLIAAGGGAFVFGHLTGDDHMSEAGLLSGEAAMNSAAITYLLKSATQRSRPYQTNGTGTFFQGGSSFPSEHAAIAWSIASVMAHEYPGTLSKVLAYGLAAGISATRVSSQQHFPSDVVIGSALGWYFGRQVYRAHHDTHLGGAPWGDLLPGNDGDQERNPENMGSSYVPLDSWVYHAMEQLIATGYVHSGFLGMRPWTRIACAQMVEEASQRIEEGDQPNGIASQLYRDLAREFSVETARLNGAANLGASLDSVYLRATNISGPPLRDGYHFGQTIINDYGRPYGEGFNAIGGAIAHAEAGPFAFYIRGEYQHAPLVASDPLSVLQATASEDNTLLFPNGSHRILPLPNGTPQMDRFRLLESGVAFAFKNLQFSFGKQSLWLGPGEAGPFLFSNNAEPIPMFRIDQLVPFRIPGLSRILGPIQTEFALGRLSGQTWISTNSTLFEPSIANQPFIHIYKISFEPTANLEFGMGISALFGGPDLPVTWKNFLRTFTTNGIPGTQSDPGDRRSTFDFSYRVPYLRNKLTIYAHSLVEDEISPLGSTRPSMQLGMHLPSVPGLSKLELRMEGLYTDVPGQLTKGFIYSNSRYASGYTNNGVLMASWIGRQGKGGEGWATYWLSARSNMQFSFRRQVVDQVFIGGGQLNDFRLNSDVALTRSLVLGAGFQYERWRFPVISPVGQRDLSLQVQLTVEPRWR